MKKSLRILTTALHALSRNIMRSMLTCLGIIIGIAAVIAMVEIGKGSSYTVQQTIAKMGANVIQLNPEEIKVNGVSTGTGGKPTLTPEDCDAITSECTAVRWAAPNVNTWSQIVYGSRNWWPNAIVGSTPAFLRIRNWTDMKQGVPFTDEDVRKSATVCVLGNTVAQKLFDNESPVGKEVRIRNVRLTVMGVCSPKGANMDGADQDNFLLAPWTTVKYRLSGSRQSSQSSHTAVAAVNQTQSLTQLYPTQTLQLYPTQSTVQASDTQEIVRFSDLDGIWISAVSPEKVSLAMDQITALLRDRHAIPDGAPPDFRLRDLTENSQGYAVTTQTINTLLQCVALISLVVGGVGIMNIMLVSVTERTREIGLRMAVGARGKDILRQFLVEAVILCLVGGIVGIGLGLFSSWVVSHWWPTRHSIPVIVLAVAVSATVGLVFGYYPAWKASRLDPIEALRYE
jgi:ABC-type antimicrobial peptide transport system permease subunit